ncbi:MAG TPA: hypothetical protein DCF63_11280 [Planctomycetaceae bacterium]|nr:hypothetical protein [Planctomycetaceae bacterium]
MPTRIIPRDSLLNIKQNRNRLQIYVELPDIALKTNIVAGFFNSLRGAFQKRSHKILLLMVTALTNRWQICFRI